MNLELKNVNFSYKKDIFILKNLDIKIKKGKITALLGINGSGKTTMFKILTGIYKPTSGAVYYNDKLISNNEIINYKFTLGFMPEYLQLYKEMTVKDVLILLSDLKGYKKLDLEKILNTVFLLEHAKKKIKHLSKGMKQRLNLAQAIIGDPEIILFDEPSNGFDCNSIDMFYNVLKKLSKNGSIVFLSSHHLTEIYGNVDQVLILSQGSIIKNIEISEIEINEKFFVKEVFILLEKINEEINLFIKNNFKEIEINKNMIYCKTNNKGIIEIISKLIKFNITIKDIRIENKFLENILNNLK